MLTETESDIHLLQKCLSPWPKGGNNAPKIWVDELADPTAFRKVAFN